MATANSKLADVPQPVSGTDTSKANLLCVMEGSVRQIPGWLKKVNDNTNAIDALRSSIFNMVYPVGSIYISVNAANPGSMFGGTWEQIKGRFLLGAGDSYTAGATGGEATHTLSVNEMPRHYHLPYIDGNTSDTSYRLFMGNDSWYNSSCGESAFRVVGDFRNRYKGFEANTNSVGSSAAHNNMPPYLAVYMWKRTA